MNVKDSGFKELLTKYKKFTVYGFSSDESKPSHQVPLFMRSQGYEFVGIYPRPGDIGGAKIYQNLKDVPADFRKFVDVFRRSENIPEVVDEAITAGGVEVLWIQLGISHPAAEKKAEAAGIKVVSNRCLLIEFKNYMT